MIVVRGAAYAALFTLCCLGVGLISEPPRRLSTDFDTWPGWARTCVEGCWTFGAWAYEHPKPALVIGGLAFVLTVLPSVVAALVSRLPRNAATDPKRLFTRDERRTAAEFADGRCEGEWLPFVRCRGHAAQGDHWYPWSLGGATNMNNLVMLCAQHNREKSNHVPTFWMTQRLLGRRKKYYPPGLDPRPGAKYGQGAMR